MHKRRIATEGSVASFMALWLLFRNTASTTIELLVLYLFLLLAIEFARRGWWVALASQIWASALLLGSLTSTFYTTTATSSGIRTASYAAFCLLTGWLLGQNLIKTTQRRSFSRRRGATWQTRPSPTIIILLLTLGLFGAFLSFRSTGIPLFSNDVDSARGAVRASSENGNLLAGTLYSAFTACVWYCVGLPWSTTVRRKPMLVSGGVLGLAGAALGGSRNDILLCVSVPVIAWLARGQRSRNPGVDSRPLLWSLRVWAPIALITFLSFGGSRVVHSASAVGRSTSSAANGDNLKAGLLLLQLNSTSQFETLGRLQQISSDLHSSGFNLYSTSRIPLLSANNDSSDYQQVMINASAPFHMTVATFAGYLILDVHGNAVTNSLMAIAIGAFLGGLAEHNRRSWKTGALLRHGLIVYVLLFSVYDFLPFSVFKIWILYLVTFLFDLQLIPDAAPHKSSQDVRYTVGTPTPV